MKNKTDAFTLIEVLITVAVLAALAGLALPTYVGSIEEARSNEAKTNLYVIYTGQKIRALSNGGYFWNASGNPTVATINTSLNIDISEQYYDISSVTANTTGTPVFSAVATRNGATRAYTITQTGVVTQSST